MVAPAAFADPPCPLPPALRSDIAYRRAHGHSWDALGVTLRYHPDALRRACEADPEFAAAQDKALAEAAWEGQADGLCRLRLLANGADDGRALHAAEVLLKYAAERRRDDTRLAVERLRADAQQARAAARPAKAGAAREEPAGPVIVGWVAAPETDAERQARFAREHAARAAEPAAEVFLWGGKHPTGRSVAPDDSDTPVRVYADWSCGVGGKRCPVYWVAPAAAKVRGGCILDPEDNADLTPAGRPPAATEP